MQLPRIAARKMLQYDTQYLWEHLEGDFVLVFDDGEIETNERACFYSSHIWEYHRQYPQTPLLCAHHVQTLMNKERSGTDTHIKLMTRVLFDVYDAYKNIVQNRRELMNQLTLMVYQISNALYNDFTHRAEAYVTGLSITDVVQITTHPLVVQAIEEMEENDAGIRRVYDTIKTVMTTDPALRYNPVSQIYKGRLANEGQLLQCLGPRGTLTDIDSHLFRKMIKRSYTQGIPDMYSALIESRSAAKSHIYSTNPLQKSEYFSRRQQLICMNVRNLHLGDCGSTRYMTWHVRDARNDETGKMASDLPTLAGKYYLDEETNQLKIIHESDTHLLGKTLKLRSVFGGCQHPDPYGICEVCFSDMASAVPDNTNLGHAMCVTMTSDLGQLILSTKHFDGSSTVEGIVLKPSEKRYLVAPVNGNSYYLNPALKGKGAKLAIGAKQAMGISDVNLVADVTALSITRVSEMSDITVMVGNDHELEIAPVVVSVNGRNASMTHELLAYIKQMGMKVESTANRDNLYIVDMSGWNYDDPILTLPLQHFNMSQLQQEISDLLESTMDQLEHRSKVVNPVSMLVEFADLVNKRLKIGLPVLEVILYSSMVVSAENHDYSLPKPWTESGVGVKQKLLAERSLGPAMGYERHRSTLTHPSSYIRTNRMDHIFDVIIAPQRLNALFEGISEQAQLMAEHGIQPK